MKSRFRRTPGAAPVLILLLAGILLPDPGSALAQKHDVLVLGVNPYQPDKMLQEMFGPLAAYLQETTGLPVEIRVGSDYQEHIKAIGTGTVDLAFLGPFPYLILTDSYGQRPLLGSIVTDGEPFFRGHIVVTENSPLTSLSQLAGKRLAFVDRYSTMYLVPYATLIQAGLSTADLAQLTFLGSHRNVALGVLAGNFAAGAVKDDIFGEFSGHGLRELAPTMKIPEHVFIATNRLEPKYVALIRSALLELGTTTAGSGILSHINPTASAVTAAKDEDFDELRNLLQYVDEGSE